jgi:hypothetical protein
VSGLAIAKKFLVPAMEELFRPSGFSAHNTAAGLPLTSFFLVPSPSVRAQVVDQAVKEFRESLGQFLSPLCRLDVVVLDKAERVLRVDFEGMVSNRQVLSHTFEVSLPTPELLWRKARARAGLPSLVLRLPASVDRAL